MLAAGLIIGFLLGLLVAFLAMRREFSFDPFYHTKRLYRTDYCERLGTHTAKWSWSKRCMYCGDPLAEGLSPVKR